MRRESRTTVATKLILAALPPHVAVGLLVYSRLWAHEAAVAACLLAYLVGIGLFRWPIKALVAKQARRDASVRKTMLIGAAAIGGPMAAAGAAVDHLSRGDGFFETALSVATGALSLGTGALAHALVLVLSRVLSRSVPQS